MTQDDQKNDESDNDDDEDDDDVEIIASQGKGKAKGKEKDKTKSKSNTLPKYVPSDDENASPSAIVTQKRKQMGRKRNATKLKSFKSNDKSDSDDSENKFLNVKNDWCSVSNAKKNKLRNRNIVLTNKVKLKQQGRLSGKIDTKNTRTRQNKGGRRQNKNKNQNKDVVGAKRKSKTANQGKPKAKKRRKSKPIRGLSELDTSDDNNKKSDEFSGMTFY